MAPCRTPVDPSDLALALALLLRFEGRNRVDSTYEIMAEVVARLLVEHLERAGFVLMKKSLEIGGAALGRGLDG